jgi:hypothetical protein
MVELQKPNLAGSAAHFTVHNALIMNDLSKLT